MAATRPRRSKQYRPRPVSQIGGLAAIDRRVPIDAESLTDLNIAYWQAFDTMLRGQSTEDSWSMVVCSLNIALMLCEQGYGKEYEPYLVRALEGAFRCEVRGRQTGSWRFDGPAINDIRLALEVHDEQVKLVSRQEMRAALLEVYRRIQTGHVYQAAA